MGVKIAKEILTVECDDGSGETDTGSREELLRRGWRMLVEVGADGQVVQGVLWVAPGHGPRERYEEGEEDAKNS